MKHVFTPLELGPVELPNRIVSTAHQTTLVHDHRPTDDFVAYHEERARGGVGLIVLEATAVHPSGLLTPHTLGGYLPEIVEGYRRVAAAVRPHGTRLFVQLFHGGREQILSPPRAPALAPSAVPSPRFRAEPRALAGTEIEELVAGYARSAELAAEAGLDGIEVSAAHRYLIEQFFDPSLNRREDAWRDGRRFLAEVVGAVRQAAQIGHEDPGFTLRVTRMRSSGGASLRRRASGVQPRAGVGAMGTNDAIAVSPPPALAAAQNEETSHLRRAS